MIINNAETIIVFFIIIVIGFKLPLFDSDDTRFGVLVGVRYTNGTRCFPPSSSNGFGVKMISAPPLRPKPQGGKGQAI